MPKNPSWTTDEDKALIDNYKSKTYREISCMLNRTEGSVKARALKIGITKERWPNENTEKFIINNYRFLSRAELSTALDIPIYSVDYYLGKHGLRYRNDVLYDTSFFDEPSVLNSALAGLIASDGCVFLRDNRVSIALLATDESLLTTWMEKIGFSGGKLIGWVNSCNNGMSTLNLFHANRWIKNLENYFNITPRKSLTLKPPKIDNIDMIKAYMSGFIDGDGCVRKRDKHLCLSVCGTEEICCWFRDLHRSWYGLPNRYSFIRRTDTNLFEYQICGRKGAYILTDLFRLDVPKMERKWKKVDDYKQANFNLS